MDIFYKKASFEKYNMLGDSNNFIILCYGKPIIEKKIAKISTLKMIPFFKKTGEEICKSIIKYREESKIYNKEFLTQKIEENRDKVKSIIDYFNSFKSYQLTRATIYKAIYNEIQKIPNINKLLNFVLLTPNEVDEIFREKYLDLIFCNEKSLPGINHHKINRSFELALETLEKNCNSIDLTTIYSFLYKNPIDINNSNLDFTNTFRSKILTIFTNYCGLYGLPYFYCNSEYFEKFQFNIKQEFSDIPLKIEYGKPEEFNKRKALKYNDFSLYNINNFLFISIAIYLLSELNDNKDLGKDDKITTNLKYKKNMDYGEYHKFPYYVDDIFELFGVNLYMNENIKDLMNLSNNINMHIQRFTNNYYGIEFNNYISKQSIKKGYKNTVVNSYFYENVLLGIWNDFFTRFLIQDDLMKKIEICEYGHTNSQKFHKTRNGLVLCENCFKEKRRKDIKKNVSNYRKKG